MNKVTDGYKHLLHIPGRADNLDDVDNHLNTAARLSRALWNALGNPDLDLKDERDREALMELASMVADHTSAAELARDKEARARQSHAGGDHE